MSTPEPQQATVGRVVHFHPAEGNGHLLPAGAPHAAIVTGSFEEGTVDLYVLPTRYSDAIHVQAVRHDDDPADDGPPHPGAEPLDPPADASDEELADAASERAAWVEANEAYMGRTIPNGSWGWPPRA